MKLLEEIKKTMELEVRSPSDTKLLFEAVFQSKDLDKLLELLRKHIGEPLKPPGKRVRFARDVAKIVDSIGGIRTEQSFYIKKEETGEYVWAALWPWQSDPSRITLKINKGNMA